VPRVIYALEAELDLLDIVDFISRDKPKTARLWLQRIRETCQTLSAHPNVGEVGSRVGYLDCRSFSVGNYVIFFRSMNDGMEVVRVIHGSRNFGYFDR